MRSVAVAVLASWTSPHTLFGAACRCNSLFSSPVHLNTTWTGMEPLLVPHLQDEELQKSRCWPRLFGDLGWKWSPWICPGWLFVFQFYKLYHCWILLGYVGMIFVPGALSKSKSWIHPSMVAIASCHMRSLETSSSTSIPVSLRPRKRPRSESGEQMVSQNVSNKASLKVFHYHIQRAWVVFFIFGFWCGYFIY